VELDLGALPLSPACRAYAAARKLDPVDLALTGGEDYELLFTAAPRQRLRLEQSADERGFILTCIGKIHPHRFGVQALSPQGKRYRLANRSYEHFT
jgi:thiamine-monophosphate kinase